MESQEITFDLEESLYRELEQLAERRGITIQQLVVEILQERIADEDYDQACRRALAHLDEGYDLGISFDTPRDELYRTFPARRKLDSLEPRPTFIKGDPEDLVDIDWSDSWEP